MESVEATDSPEVREPETDTDCSVQTADTTPTLEQNVDVQSSSTEGIYERNSVAWHDVLETMSNDCATAKGQRSVVLFGNQDRRSIAEW